MKTHRRYGFLFLAAFCSATVAMGAPEKLFSSVTLRHTPRDWASVVRQSNPEGHLDHTMHGVLERYDLPVLLRLAGHEKVAYE